MKLALLITSVPHESNRIELSQIRIRFDRITNRIWTIRIRTNRIWTIRIRFGFDSNSVIITWRYTNFQKRKFLFSRKLKFALHKVAQISKKGNLFADHSIRFEFDSDSVNSDSIRIRFDSDRIEFHQFGFDSQITNPNRIRIRIRIWFDSTNRLRNPKCMVVFLCSVGYVWLIYFHTCMVRKFSNSIHVWFKIFQIPYIVHCVTFKNVFDFF